MKRRDRSPAVAPWNRQGYGNNAIHPYVVDVVLDPLPPGEGRGEGAELPPHSSLGPASIYSKQMNRPCPR
jgi:hypothetical protein